MIGFLLIAQMISSHPPLSPADAIAILQASHSEADHTWALAHPQRTVDHDYDWLKPEPSIYVMASSTGEGPYGPFPAYPAPINTTVGWEYGRPYGYGYGGYGGYYGGYGYRPYGYGGGYRVNHYRGQTSFPRPTPYTVPRYTAPATRYTAPAPRSVVMAPAQSAGVRRR
jgi:hypothetical protein